MKRNVLLLSILIFAISISVVLVACSAGEKLNTEGRTSVVFELEGGLFQNCEGKVTHYYQLPESGETLIYSPQELSSREVTREKHTFGGWFKTKNGSGESATYSDEWDFQTDKLTTAGLTLYAKWIPNVKQTYEVCYLNDAGEKVSLGFYNVVAGDKFDDWLNYAKKRNGYTPLSFTDKDGNPWDPDYEFPSVADEDLNVEVFVNYLKGRFTIVNTGAELTKAMTRTANIYLNADVDLNGAYLNFKNYAGIFMGNGHTVSNFKVWYTAQADELGEDMITYASILGNVDKATVENVTFADAVLDFKTTLSKTKGVRIAPLSVNVNDSTLTNVKIKGLTINLNGVPSGLSKDEIIVLTDGACMNVDETSKIENCTIEGVTYNDNTKK